MLNQTNYERKLNNKLITVKAELHYYNKMVSGSYLNKQEKELYTKEVEKCEETISELNEMFEIIKSA